MGAGSPMWAFSQMCKDRELLPPQALESYAKNTTQQFHWMASGSLIRPQRYNGIARENAQLKEAILATKSNGWPSVSIAANNRNDKLQPDLGDTGWDTS